MNSTVFTKSLIPPHIDKRTALIYAGCRTKDESTTVLLDMCIEEAKEFKYDVCYCTADFCAEGSVCSFGTFSAVSKDLAAHMDGCGKALVFAATVGIGIDRLIVKYSQISPSKALLFQALGTERIEALCDTFCSEFAKENGVLLTPRFSPGYGDLSIKEQKNIFTMLDCPKRIGLTLNESLLMSPSKSVTAIVGIKKECDK